MNLREPRKGIRMVSPLICFRAKCAREEDMANVQPAAQKTMGKMQMSMKRLCLWVVTLSACLCSQLFFEVLRRCGYRWMGGAGLQLRLSGYAGWYSRVYVLVQLLKNESSTRGGGGEVGGGGGGNVCGQSTFTCATRCRYIVEAEYSCVKLHWVMQRYDRMRHCGHCGNMILVRYQRRGS